MMTLFTWFLTVLIVVFLCLYFLILFLGIHSRDARISKSTADFKTDHDIIKGKIRGAVNKNTELVRFCKENIGPFSVQALVDDLIWYYQMNVMYYPSVINQTEYFYEDILDKKIITTVKYIEMKDPKLFKMPEIVSELCSLPSNTRAYYMTIVIVFTDNHQMEDSFIPKRFDLKVLMPLFYE